ncbi:toprim domain-containing protein [Bacteriovorax sp. DB6_IX]|uniref:toprim domain-containing protein n=1 Tax=Bacteriovorax sp. DB6_IX TaxID=1353530 RepID=UPI00038A4576|nr:toprim domain-containing protein [Bacteriovorax sp. DB6_IX]EQC50601.1 DNA gyrase, B subunit, C-terminal domain protein [Bacteriovorax sp. DB6_IX]
MGRIESVKRKGKAQDAVIESKDQRWHCRNRITLVFGSNDIEELDTYIYEEHAVNFKTVKFHQAKSKAVEEILDNCIDEFYRGHVTEVHTKLSPDGKTVTITDNGIGFPLDKIPQVYSEFRTGSKFKDEETDKKGFLHRTLGQNGLGAAATCLTSDEFSVTVRHYNSKQEQTYNFIDGALKVKKSKKKKFTGPSGVSVSVTLAKEVYKDPIIDEDLLRKRIIDLAYNNPGLAFYFNGEKYHYQKGLYELAYRIDEAHAQHFGDYSYVYETENTKKKKVKGLIDMSLSFSIHKASEEREKFISFVNSTPTYDGGFHHDRVRRSFINGIKDKLERTAKKERVKLVDNDILQGLTFVLGITMPNPRFESQTKRKLVRDLFLEKALDEFMTKNIDKFLRKNKDYLEVVIDRAKSRHKYQDLKDAVKKARKQKRQRVEKLLDANERKKRHLCSLFICEGDSAIGGLRSARNKLYQGGIALRGKPMNVAQAGIKDILNNQEFSDIMASIGLTLGQEAEPDKMRYSKVVFLADSDVDGGHINTLLTNFFYQFWPELFKMGCIQIAKAPLFEVITDKKTHYFESDKELESFKKQSSEKIREIHRNKGLGEMSPEAWKYVLSKEKYTEISIQDGGLAKEMLNICFGKDTNLRKELLMDINEGEETSVTLGKTDAEKSGSSSSKTTEEKAAKKVLRKSRNCKKGQENCEETAKTAKKAAKKAAKKVTKKKAAPVKKTSKKAAKKTKTSAKKKATGSLADMINYID